MHVYLNCCCLQRPYDDQTQPRIRVETEAVLALLALVQTGDIGLLSSEALEYELARIPDEARRCDATSLLSLAERRLLITNEAELLAEQIQEKGIAAMDAVHLAVASSAGADFFVTCDDRLLRTGRSIPGLKCKVVSLFEMISEALE